MSRLVRLFEKVQSQAHRNSRTYLSVINQKANKFALITLSHYRPVLHLQSILLRQLSLVTFDSTVHLLTFIVNLVLYIFATIIIIANANVVIINTKKNYKNCRTTYYFFHALMIVLSRACYMLSVVVKDVYTTFVYK